MDQNTAQRLYKYRKENGYSQEELAEKIGVSRQAISKWERCESSPDTDNLIALARLYGVSIDELINGTAEPVAAAPVVAEPAFQQTAPAPAEKDSVNTLPPQPQPAEMENEGHSPRGAIIVICGVILFLLTGMLLKWWAFSWIFILLAICANSLIEAVKRKEPERFTYPLLVVSVYCGIGLTAGVWNVTWLLFLTLPIYYLLCKEYRRKRDGADSDGAPMPVQTDGKERRSALLLIILATVLGVSALGVGGGVLVHYLKQPHTEKGAAVSTVEEKENYRVYSEIGYTVGGGEVAADKVKSIQLDWADTTSGNLLLNSNAQSVQLDSVSGTAELHSAALQSLHCDTASGSLFLTQEGAAK